MSCFYIVLATGKGLCSVSSKRSKDNTEAIKEKSFLFKDVSEIYQRKHDKSETGTNSVQSALMEYLGEAVCVGFTQIVPPTCFESPR